MKEKWKDIEGFEGIYKVSDQGNVLSLNFGAKNHSLSGEQKILSLSKSSSGYYHVQLYKNGVASTKLIHILVADAFLPKPEGKTEINHIDGNKANNAVSNLEWVTHQENLKHAVDTGLKRRSPMIGKTGRKNVLSKPVIQSKPDGTVVKTWDSSFDAQSEGGFNQNSIRSCACGFTKTYKGFVWRYAEV